MRLGVVGAGPIIPFHLSALEAQGFSPVAFLARPESTSTKILALKYDAKPCWSVGEFLEVPCDAFLIACQAEFLGRYLQLLSELQKPILIEKPVFLKSEDYLPLLEDEFLSQNIMVGYNRRFYSSVLELKEIINQSQDCFLDILVAENSWASHMTLAEKQHTVLTNSVHMIDLMRFLMDDNLSLEFASKTELNEYRGSTSIFRSDKVTTSLRLYFDSPTNYSINLYKHNSAIVLSPLEAIKSYSGMTVREPSDQFPIRQYLPVLAYESSNFKSGFKPGFLEQAKEFKHLVENRVLGLNAARLSDAFHATRIAEKLLGFS